MLGFLVNRANKVPQLQREFLVIYENGFLNMKILVFFLF
jgi:hypothetical protein